MDTVKIQNTAYMELIDSSRNHFKFYRIIYLDNGKAVIAYGRIGTENAAVKVYNHSQAADKYWEKRDKGYAEKSDTYINHQYINVQKAGFVVHDDLGSTGRVPDSDSYDKEKYEKVLDKIDLLVESLNETDGDHASEYVNRARLIKRLVMKDKTISRDQLLELKDMWEYYADLSTV